MKKLVFLFMLIFNLEITLSSQTNLVPNGSFEVHSSCPFNMNTVKPDEVAKATGWYTAKDSPDYYHSCATNSYVGTPLNMVGFQIPASGSAYMGLISYMPGTPEYREVIEAPLLFPLVKNKKYFLKMSLSTSNGYQVNFCSGDNKVGMRLSTISHSTSPPLLYDFAHLTPGGVILDTLNWVTVFTSIIADSAYKYVDIGNFFSSNSISYQLVKQNSAASYYFIDDVCISSDSLFAATWTSLYENDYSSKAIIYPNPASDFITISLPDNIPIDKVIFRNELGQEMAVESDLISGKIVLRNIADGLYVLQIRSGDKHFIDKLVVSR